MKFSADDFKAFGYSNEKISPQTASEIANAKLEKMKNESPLVYCSKPDKECSHLWNHFETKGFDTHKARLMFIEEIAKEPCDHKTNGNTVQVWNGNELVGVISHCIKCKVQLNAEWKEVK